MDAEKATLFLAAERRRLLSALQQLNVSNQQLQEQFTANTRSREELDQRLKLIDEALGGEQPKDVHNDEPSVPAA